MSSEVANAPENLPAEPNNNNQPRNNLWTMMKGFIFRMMVIYFISSFFRRSPVTENQSGIRPPVSVLAGINLYQKGTWFDLYVYASDLYTFNDFNNSASLFWHIKNIEYGDWHAGPNKDGSYEKAGVIYPSEILKNNGSFYLHIYIVPSGHSPDPQSKNYDKKLTIYKNKVLTKHKKRKLRRTSNLLTGETDTPNELKANKSMESHLPPITHWHPNMTIQMLDDHTSWTPGSVPPPLNEMVEFYSSTSEYYPVIFLNDYWNLAQDYTVVNETVAELPLNLVFSPISLFKLQLYAAQSMRSKWYGGMFGESMMQESDEEQDTLKKTMLDTNPYLLGITVIVSIVHSIFEFLAFKNDIQFWRNRESLEGLSVRSVFFNVFQSIIVVLYVLDNDTNFMVKVSVVLGLLIEVWKIKKVINITVNRDQLILGVFPRISFAHKSSYTESDTKKYDQLAFKYLSWILFPLLVGYAIYSLIYLEHTGWYSWVLSMSYGFLLMFGFIMMTPQLFINYKMKSVAHLPWRKLTYKALNTFIDDIFAFVIKMPTLYRIGCLRDDVIFFIYLYQRWIYPIDPKRPNEYGVSQEMIEKYEAEKSAENNAIPSGQASIENGAVETTSSSAVECDEEETKKTK